MTEPDLSNWILYQDQYILVINKPAGTLSIPDGYRPEFPHLKSILEPVFGRLLIVHRLDKDTSGVMVIARTESTHRSLNLQFDNRITRKEYQALILGNPSWDELTIASPVSVNGDRSHRTRVFPNKGKPAQTGFSLVFRWEAVSQVIAHPHTGYTHQIRAHISSIGYPILFDSLYTPPELTKLASRFRDAYEIDSDDQRMMLHASQISFIHPENEARVSFRAPLPDDMERVIRLLNKKRSSG